MRGTQDASHIWQLGCANCICGSTCLFLWKTNVSSVLKKHSATLFHNPKQDVRMAMQGDFECSLDAHRFKHIDIEVQRRHERHGRTPEFKGSNLRLDSMRKTETMRKYTKMETTRRNTGWIQRKTELDSEEDSRDKVQICLFGWTKTLSGGSNEGVSVKKEKNCASVAIKSIVISVMQCCLERKMVSNRQDGGEKPTQRLQTWYV